ncbi:glycosyltransferase family 25 protein [Persicirhabdus sediminis]|uniref:Glycosyltransferase family 25 protein n=1 Tax=Persicirhabdus sediminis TaxID=454144 RepID=A0A8J7MDC2_9BACT|nr:glycosyltransferase family 25 protein [Persicirhabdus sediminis]MBK1790522.1 glycosyltransferase family 25 protein [Persicirhabdus sediminis]
MKVFVINLKDSVVRRKKCEQVLHGLDFPYEFVEAVDGRGKDAGEMSDLYTDRLRKVHSVRPMSGGEMGCFLSHLRVMEQIANGDLPWAVIMEDDVKLVGDLNQLMHSLAVYEEHWELLYLHRHIASRKEVIEKAIDDHYSIASLRYYDMGTQCYAVTKGAARKFLDSITEIHDAIDMVLCRPWFHGCVIRAIDPPIVCHALEDESTIQNDPPKLMRYEYDLLSLIFVKARKKWWRLSNWILFRYYAHIKKMI